MNALLRNRSVLAWLALVAATLAAWALASEGGAGTLHPDTAVTTGVLLLAAAKARMVMRVFMETRTAPAWLALACDAWLLAAFALLLALAWA